MSADEFGRRVVVILDPDFGERLRDRWPGAAVWISMSPVNAPVVHALWQSAGDKSHLTGITGMTFRSGVQPEKWLLDDIETIDLHHGPYSSARPYTILEVIGAPRTSEIRAALAKLGFSTFRSGDGRFTAERFEEEAKRLRP